MKIKYASRALNYNFVFIKSKSCCFNFWFFILVLALKLLCKGLKKEKSLITNSTVAELARMLYTLYTYSVIRCSPSRQDIAAEEGVRDKYVSFE